MMPKVRGFTCSLAALAWLIAAGCGSDQPPCAQVSGQFQLGSSALTLTKNAVLLRVGEGFVLAGFDGTAVRWGQLSSAGEIAGESAFVLPEQPAKTTGGQPLGPVFAVTQKLTPGDQLVAVVGVPQAGTADYYEIHAYFHDLGSTEAPTMRILGQLAAAPNSGTIRLVASSSPFGTVALVLWGVEGQLANINFQVLGADGMPIGELQKLFDPTNVPLWSCVDATQNGSSLAITLVEAPNSTHPDRPAWRRFSVNDDSSVGEIDGFDLKFDVSDCRIVSTPAPEGHLVAWQDNSSRGGTYFALMTPPAPDAGADELPDVTTHMVLASEPFGGYSRMPKLAWIAPAAYEFTIGLVRTNGPEVVRFNVFADPRGQALYLPSVSGHTGPVSAWVGPDAAWVTYLDMKGSTAPADAAVSADSTRLLVKVTPATLL